MFESTNPSSTPPITYQDSRYLFPIHIGEQETKASSHLLQLGLLSLALNRTLVLPKLGSGYLTQCAPLSFEAYYASQTLSRWKVRTITQEEVESSSGEDHIDGQMISLSRPTSKNISTKFSSHLRCLPPHLSSRLSIASEPIVFHGSPGWHRSPSTRRAFATTLVTKLTKMTTKILLVNWEMLYPVFDPSPAYVHLEYNPALEMVAEKLVSLLGGPRNVLGLHWRQETVGLAALERCAKSLDERLRTEPQPPEWLWIASDYPFESLLSGHATPKLAHSGTFHSLSDAHHAIMASLIEKLSQRSEEGSLKPTSLGTMLRRSDMKIMGLEKDRGVWGILEKLVLRQLDRVWLGDERCSKGSSYARQVVEMHHHLSSVVGGGEAKGRKVEFWG